MSTPIYIGTRGWDDPAWGARFYPEELPDDWRFCYYSNRIRAVLVPAAVVASVTATTVPQWIDDSDPDFAMVLEVPADLARPSADANALDVFVTRMAALKGQLAGWLLAPAIGPVEARWLSATLDRLNAIAPVCLDLAGRADDPAIEHVRISHRAGRCWRPAQEPAPMADGELLVCLATEGTPRGQRRLLEDINKWQAQHRAAGLFFEGPDAAAQAEQARVLAELMGI